jgi:choline dehydrogenase-like flavoprotein
MAEDMTREADYAVVGGGAAGCVLAARLSQDPGCQVLLLEAGPELEPGTVGTPGTALQLLGSDAVYGDLTVPQDAVGNRQIPLPTGRGLGGGSSVNTLTWLACRSAATSTGRPGLASASPSRISATASSARAWPCMAWRTCTWPTRR